MFARESGTVIGKVRLSSYRLRLSVTLPVDEGTLNSMAPRVSMKRMLINGEIEEAISELERTNNKVLANPSIQLEA